MNQISYGTITIVDTHDVERMYAVYAKSNSKNTQPSAELSTWSESISTAPGSGDYIWQCIVVEKSGTHELNYGDKVCISGDKGSDGRSLSNTITEYTTVAANVTITGGASGTHRNYTWYTNIPEYNANTPAYWFRITNTYTNPSSTEYIVHKDNGITDAMATADAADKKATQAASDAAEAKEIAETTQENLIDYESANNANITALQSRLKRIWINEVTSGDYVAGTYAASGINGTTFAENNPSTYGYNTLLRHNKLALRYNTIDMTTLTTNELTFYYPKQDASKTPPYVQGESALNISSDGLKIYEKYTGTGNPETTANLNARLAVELTTSGLVIKKGSIIIGTKTDNTTGYVTLSDTDFTRTINSTSRSNLRMAIGSNFGVKNDGTLYASNAVISGQITVNDNSNVYTKDQSYTKDQVATLAGWSVRINVTAISYVSNTATLEAILYYKGNEATSTDLSGATYAYQWYKNTTAISGATSATLSVTNTSALGLNGIYTCKVNVTKHSVSNTASNSVDLMSLQAAGEPNKYITRISDSGIKIHPQNNATTNYVQIDGDGTYIYKNGVEQAHFKNDILIGATSQIGHIRIDSTYGIRFLRGDDNTRMAQLASDGLQIFKYTAASGSTSATNTSVAWLGENPRIGALTTEGHIEISPTSTVGFNIYNGYTTSSNAKSYLRIALDSNSSPFIRVGLDSAYNVYITSNAVNFMNNGTEIGYISGTSARLGKENAQHTIINTGGLEIYNSSNTCIAELKANTRIGAIDQDGQVRINSTGDYTGFYITDPNFAHSYVHINSTEARFGLTSGRYVHINNSNGNVAIRKIVTVDGASTVRELLSITNDGIYLRHDDGTLKAFVGSYLQLGSTANNCYATMNATSFTVNTKTATEAATAGSTFSQTVFLGTDSDDDYNPFIRIGRKTTAGHITISASNGIRFWNSGESKAQMQIGGSAIILGELTANRIYTYIDSSGIYMRKRNSANTGYATTYVSITPSGASFSGSVTASSGQIGSWVITGGGLESGATASDGQYYRCGIQPTTAGLNTGASAFYAGCTTQPGNTVADPSVTNFFVTHNGKLFCTDVQLGTSTYGYIVFNQFTSTSNVKKSNWRPNANSKSDLGSTNYYWDYIYSSHNLVTSDRKEKDGIIPINKAEDFILALQPVNYYFKNGNHLRQHMGFIAQDVSDICKQLGLNLSVTNAGYKDKEGHEYYGEEVDDNLLNWSLDYKEFIAPLVKVVQVQHKEIEELKQRITQLENR